MFVPQYLFVTFGFIDVQNQSTKYFVFLCARIKLK